MVFCLYFLTSLVLKRVSSYSPAIIGSEVSQDTKIECAKKEIPL